MNFLKFSTWLKIFFIVYIHCDCFNLQDFCFLPDGLGNHVECKVYSCGNKYCSLAGKDCGALSFWTYLTNINIQSFSRARFRNKVFLDSIKKCSSDQYVFTITEVCSKKFCLKQNKMASGFKLKNLRLCECKGKYGFNCGHGHCATSKHACKKIIEKSYNQSSIKNINSC